MTSADAINKIYEGAKEGGFKVSNIKIADRRNKRGKYTFIEVQYLIPGEPNADETTEVTPVATVPQGYETPEDNLFNNIETR